MWLRLDENRCAPYTVEFRFLAAPAAVFLPLETRDYRKFEMPGTSAPR